MHVMGAVFGLRSLGSHAPFARTRTTQTGHGTTPTPLSLRKSQSRDSVLVITLPLPAGTTHSWQIRRVV